MERKIWGIMLSILGIGGLIMALININGPEINKHLPVLFAAGIFGAIAFFAGIWLTDRKTVRQSGQNPGLMRVTKSN